MGREATGTVGERGGAASRAELDALCSVMTATVDIAEQARSEAAIVLLRRALALVRGRGTHHDEARGEAASDFRTC